MTRQTRRSVLAAVGVGLASAGCLTDSGGTDPETTERTSTDGTAVTETTTSGETTRTPEDPITETTTDETDDYWSDAADEPDPDHEISVRNEDSAARTLRVWVQRRGANETLFETTVDLPPDATRTVYNLRETDPDGVERFQVCAELVSESESDSSYQDCANVATSECYGDVHPTIDDDGSVQIIYAIC